MLPRRAARALLMYRADALLTSLVPHAVMARSFALRPLLALLLILVMAPAALATGRGLNAACLKTGTYRSRSGWQGGVNNGGALCADKNDKPLGTCCSGRCMLISSTMGVWRCSN